MRIAIVGGGISGNTCVGLLHRNHDVTLFEANDYVGGHTNTIDIGAYGGSYTVDTGFMVYNERTYPNFTRLLSELQVETQDSDMSFSVSCERTGLEYQGSSVNGLFAQRSNLIRPAFYRLLWEICRFNRRATEVRETLSDDLTLEQFLRAEGFHADLVELYLLPMTAAIWSASPAQVRVMPARFLMQFFHNHGLLQLRDRPQWKTIVGGARRYVRALLQPLSLRNLRLNSPVQRVTRLASEVVIETQAGASESFDAVIMACHADQALRMLTDASNAEYSILNQFPYQRNLAILHTEVGMLPRRSAAWASW
ncbi:MAG: FAD-dependent oxidoreductase, partial [Planctomycetales bacterium]|nr:FAD-dependent oxidoreductase [Planctomycetales bacterium]